MRIPLPSAPDLLALHRADPVRFPCLLESAARGARGRFDMLLVSEGRAFERTSDGRLHGASGPRPREHGFLDELAAAFRAEAVSTPSDQLFVGGWALFLGYELADEIEPVLSLPRSPGLLPVARAVRCPLALVLDRDTGLCTLQGEASSGALAAEVALQAARVLPSAYRPVAVRRVEEDTPDRFLGAVRRALDYIAAGDVFQVNLSRGWSAALDAGTAPADLYAALRRANPAPFSALFDFGEGRAVVSSSPERLVSRRGDRIETRPIAGTRPRMPGDDDAVRVRELVGHSKERAEHIMLIDLERNDLGRVCRRGSVRVEALMEVETYAHVHHIESTVSGVAESGVGPADLIRAVFPGGTITGCPKVRCMQIIAELENVGRGAYTGAVGWLGRNGDLDLNILIRTLAVEGDTCRFRAGAGVVADSDPDAELVETRAKARGMLRALGEASA